MPKTRSTKKPAAKGRSAVTAVRRRSIPERVRMVLVALAGGRCEFDGCNRFLFEHHVTLSWRNFGEAAHIVAFSSEGPRGEHEERPPDIHDLSNLLLLCRDCHKEIDDDPETYTVDVVREYKAAHEERIHYLTELAPERKTTALTLVSQVRGQQVGIPFAQIVQAVSPRYPSTRRPCQINLGNLEEGSAGFLDAANAAIVAQLGRYLGPQSEFAETNHLSLFALARISLLISAGAHLGNKIPVDLYQRHRDTGDWTWKTNGEAVEFAFHRRHQGQGGLVALLLSLSGPIADADLPTKVLKEYSIYEIFPRDLVPGPELLRMRQDLANFRRVYVAALGTILENHGLLELVALFPAVPAPVAVVCGQELLPKAHPALEVYELEADGYKPAILIHPKQKEAS